MKKVQALGRLIGIGFCLLGFGWTTCIAHRVGGSQQFCYRERFKKEGRIKVKVMSEFQSYFLLVSALVSVFSVKSILPYQLIAHSSCFATLIPSILLVCLVSICILLSDGIITLDQSIVQLIPSSVCDRGPSLQWYEVLV